MCIKESATVRHVGTYRETAGESEGEKDEVGDKHAAPSLDFSRAWSKGEAKR